MSRSANEVAMLVQKAARGAGFPPAQAERFGQAVVLHLASDGAATDVTDALSNPKDSPVLRLPLLLEDVQRAVALAGPHVELTLHPGDEALAPAYARLLPMQILACQVVVPDEGQSRLHLKTAPRNEDPHNALPARIAAPDALIKTLDDLAQLSFVPASDASRRAGAGAGNIDND